MYKYERSRAPIRNLGKHKIKTAWTFFFFLPPMRIQSAYALLNVKTNAKAMNHVCCTGVTCQSVFCDWYSQNLKYERAQKKKNRSRSFWWTEAQGTSELVMEEHYWLKPQDWDEKGRINTNNSVFFSSLVILGVLVTNALFGHVSFFFSWFYFYLCNLTKTSENTSRCASGVHMNSFNCLLARVTRFCARTRLCVHTNSEG